MGQGRHTLRSISDPVYPLPMVESHVYTVGSPAARMTTATVGIGDALNVI